MPLTYPPPPGINMFCRAGKHFKTLISITRSLHTAKAIPKDQIRTENKHKCTPPFASWDIAGTGDLTIQCFITNHRINSGIKLSLN